MPTRLKKFTGGISIAMFLVFLTWIFWIPFDLYTIYRKPDAPACKVVLTDSKLIMMAPGLYFGCSLWATK